MHVFVAEVPPVFVVVMVMAMIAMAVTAMTWKPAAFRVEM